VVHQIHQRLSLVQAGSKQKTETARTQQVRSSIAVERFDELLVPRLPKKGKRCEQGTDADTGHDLELRSITATAKSNQRSGTKRATGAATGECQDIERAAAGCRTESPLYFIRAGAKELTVNAK
jgi:hypothetical protein